jgi:hypothetical protein
MKKIPKFIIFEILKHRQFFADHAVKTDNNTIINLLGEKKLQRAQVVYGKDPHTATKDPKIITLALLHGNTKFPLAEFFPGSLVVKTRLRFQSNDIHDAIAKNINGRYIENWICFFHSLMIFFFKNAKYNGTKVPVYLVKFFTQDTTCINTFINYYSHPYSEEDLHCIFDVCCKIGSFVNLCVKYPSLREKFKPLSENIHSVGDFV